MIRSQIADAQTVLGDEEVALCQRVFEHISSVRRITTDTEREGRGRVNATVDLRSLLSVKFIPALALVHDYEKRCFVRLGLAAGADRIR
ncbi:hypothetical protein GR215_21115 [Rhizobium leguminosarum]|nr:hypothetical protein [Rhizobium leguminosarum]